ncbi:MAG: hypothetical protein ACR2HR_10265 [Euzebya sp.]
MDNDLRVIRWNRAAEKLTGFTAGQSLGGPLPHLTGSQQTSLRHAAGRCGRPIPAPICVVSIPSGWPAALVPKTPCRRCRSSSANLRARSG